MPEVLRDGVTIHYEVSGPDDGAPVVFSNSLGTTLHLWDPILPYLPDGLRIIRYDTRGHGQSGTPPAPYTMGQLISDGVALSLPENTTVELCISADQGIPRDPEMIYPVADFAGYNATYYGEVDVIRCLQTAYLPRREEESEVVNRSHQRPAHPRG